MYSVGDLIQIGVYTGFQLSPDVDHALQKRDSYVYLKRFSGWKRRGPDLHRPAPSNQAVAQHCRRARRALRAGRGWHGSSEGRAQGQASGARRDETRRHVDGSGVAARAYGPDVGDGVFAGSGFATGKLSPISVDKALFFADKGPAQRAGSPMPVF